MRTRRARLERLVSLFETLSDLKQARLTELKREEGLLEARMREALVITASAEDPAMRKFAWQSLPAIVRAGADLSQKREVAQGEYLNAERRARSAAGSLRRTMAVIEGAEARRAIEETRLSFDDPASGKPARDKLGPKGPAMP